MRQRDYERVAKQCAAQADAMKPGPERDALLAKARQYRSYANMENWIASKEATAACELVPWGVKLAGCTLAKKTRTAKTLRVFFGPEVKTGARTADSGRAANATDGETLGGASVICRETAQARKRKVAF